MDQIENIGKNIRICRKEAGLSQPQLAKLVGVSHAAISYWENGVNIPNVRDCWLIADVLQISIDQLVGRKD